MLHMHMWAGEDQRSMPSVFLNLSAPCLLADRISSWTLSTRLASQLASWICLSPPFPPTLEFQTCSTMPGFDVGARIWTQPLVGPALFALKHVNQESISRSFLISMFKRLVVKLPIIHSQKLSMTAWLWEIRTWAVKPPFRTRPPTRSSQRNQNAGTFPVPSNLFRGRKDLEDNKGTLHSALYLTKGTSDSCWKD